MTIRCLSVAEEMDDSLDVMDSAAFELGKKCTAEICSQFLLKFKGV